LWSFRDETSSAAPAQGTVDGHNGKERKIDKTWQVAEPLR
jgi:hypothetical protein